MLSNFYSISAISNSSTIEYIYCYIVYKIYLCNQGDELKNVEKFPFTPLTDDVLISTNYFETICYIIKLIINYIKHFSLIIFYYLAW